MKKVSLKTGAWCGDKTIDLSLPENWKISLFGGNPPAPKNQNEIEKQLHNPIKSLPLSKLAQNRKNAVIVIDDIMRPTPTAKILPLVIEQLEKAGLKKKNIKIVIASGSHQKTNIKDIELKVEKNS